MNKAPAPFNSPEHDKTMAAVRAAQERGEDPFGDDDPLPGEEAAADDVEEDEDDDLADDAKGEDKPAADDKKADDKPAADGKTEGEKEEEDEDVDADALAAVAGDDDEDDGEPAYTVASVDFKAERKKLDDEEAAVEAKWGEGNLTDEERSKELARLRNERETIVRQETRAETIADLNYQTDLRSKTKVLVAIATASKEAGELDYSDNKVSTAYDGMLKAVMSDPENAGKKFKELAQLAHEGLCAVKNVKRKAAETDTPSTEKKDAEGKPAADAKPGAKKDRSTPDLPVTLRGVPNAATANTGGGPLDALAGLKGQAYQAAYNALPAHLKAKLLDE